MKHILCVDDIESNLFTLEALLNSPKVGDYKTITVTSAKEALNILLTTTIDLILLDVMMPDIDGFACAKMIKSNKKTKNIPIIFLTAKTEDETIETCYGVGGVDYVSKPFNAIELLLD